MKEQEIESGNILIAKYEGYNPCRKASILDYVDNEVSIDGLQYHESWDWLMPVVLKIMQENETNNALIFNWASTTWFASIYSQGYSKSKVDNSPILAVWQCVVNYLKNK